MIARRRIKLLRADPKVISLERRESWNALTTIRRPSMPRRNISLAIAERILPGQMVTLMFTEPEYELAKVYGHEH